MAENLIVPAIIIAALAVLCSNDGTIAVNWIMQDYKKRILASLAVIAAIAFVVISAVISQHNPFAIWG